MEGINSRNSSVIYIGVIIMDKIYHEDFSTMIQARFQHLLFKSSVEAVELMCWLNSSDELDYIDNILDISGLSRMCLEHLPCSIVIIESDSFRDCEIYTQVLNILQTNSIVHRFVENCTKLCVLNPYQANDLEILFQPVDMIYSVYSTVIENIDMDIHDLRSQFVNNFYQLRFFERFDIFIENDNTDDVINWVLCPYLFKITCDSSYHGQHEIIDLVMDNYPSTEIKNIVGHDCVEYWMTDLDDLTELLSLFFDKQLYATIDEIPFHKLVMKSISFKYQMSLMFNILSRHGVRFAVINSDGDILLHSAMDYMRIRHIFDDCDITIHLSSFEIIDCRPDYHHNFPEIHQEPEDESDLDTSNEFLDSTSDDELQPGLIAIGLSVYTNEE